ncbi:hypothetical protein [Microbacterium sp. B24]|uniref:hypothetical protein n=1 Tax=Microbacterium sp. B24 TaxID=95616 RepID=UPI0011D1E1E4|nr:hypothetical protein [Microbacterium sp. B24]
MLPYFDGATVDSTGIAYSYDGTPGASTSTARAEIGEVRKNFCARPLGPASPVNTVSGYGAVNGATISGDASAAGVVVDCSGGTVTDAGVAIGGVVADPGVATVTASVDITGITAGQWRLSAQGPWVASSVNGSYVSIAAGETKRMSLTFNVTASGVARALYVLRGPTAGGSEKARISSVLVEVAGAALPFFDGSTTPDVDLVPAWQNTEHTTTSTLSGVKVNRAGSVLYHSIVRSWTGDARIDRRDGGGGWAVAAQDLPNAAGRTYTVLCEIEARSAVSSVSVGIDRSGLPSVPIATESSLTPGAVRVFRATYVGNDAGSNARINIPIAPVGASLALRRMAVIDGIYSGPYLDGDMPGCIWRGTPHASQSVGYPATV